MSVASPHIALLWLGLRAVERGSGFEEAVTRLVRAREEAAREVARLEAARSKGREGEA